MKKLLFALFASVSLFTLADVSASVTDVVVQQQWPWSPEVLVSFKVGNLANNESVDVVLKGQVGGTTIDIPDSVVKGLRKGLTSGGYTCTFNPASVPELANKNVVTDFKVDVTTTPSAIDPSEPLYMIVDLTKASGEEGQITYLSRNDIMSGNYGTYERKPSWIQNSSALDDCLIWTGVNENSEYKTSKLVFRRVKAGTFMMGSPDGEEGKVTTSRNNGIGFDDYHQVTLTKDFWIGVFELTKTQKAYIAGEDVSVVNTAPIDKYSMASMRGTGAGAKWPTNADDEANVDADSLLGKLRAQIGFKVDLPTEAQWEYACRAGTTTQLNSGLNVSNETGTVCNADVLAWYQNHAPRAVGGKLPNAWGLYDMHGNVYEFCLDYFSENLGANPVTDPKGVDKTKWEGDSGYAWYYFNRITRGGSSWSNNPTGLRSASRYSRSFTTEQDAFGFRLAIHVAE